MSETRVVHYLDRVEGAVYIGRPNSRYRLGVSLWANPYKIGKDGDRAEVIRKFEAYLLDKLRMPTGHWAEALIALRGKPLACWCRHEGEERTPATLCHGDILVALLNTFTDQQLLAMREEAA